jgi:hypothetical protein
MVVQYPHSGGLAGSGATADSLSGFEDRNLHTGTGEHYCGR